MCNLRTLSLLVGVLLVGSLTGEAHGQVDPYQPSPSGPMYPQGLISPRGRLIISGQVSPQGLLIIQARLIPAARLAPTGGVAGLRVWLPENATLLVDGQPTKQTGDQRVFYSPPVAAGKRYTYNLKACWDENGQTVERERTVAVAAGRLTDVSFFQGKKETHEEPEIRPSVQPDLPVAPAPSVQPDPPVSPAPSVQPSPAPSRPRETLPVVRSENPVVVLDTSLGTMKIELYMKTAPEKAMAEQFLSYVNRADRFYDGTIFHSVTDSMIQGGIFQANLRPKPTAPPVDCESYFNRSNERGTIAMVQRREIDENMNITTPFLINVKDNKQLDDANNKIGSCVFGKVIEGLDVLDKIAATKTARKGGFANVPIKNVVIKSIRVEK
jgi:peptidyl-prolyl cis-trans isomerase A (cyclophilin A)